MANLRIIERFKAFQAREDAKRKAMKERLEHMEPFREQMLRRIIIAALSVLPLVAFLAFRVRMDLKSAAGGLITPAIALLVALLCMYLAKGHWRIGLATGLLFLAITFAATSMQAVMIKMGMHGFPQFGGILMLTIVLSGLLIGEFFVGIWTFICCVSLQMAVNGPNGTAFNLGWDVVYIVCGFLVLLFSRHMELFHEAGRRAEEQQRSAVVAERTRFARDIHDTLAQGFTGILLQLNAAEQRIQSGGEQARIHIEKARQLANESLEEARRSVSALRVGVAGSLLDAIAQIGNRVVSDSGIELETKVEGQPYSLAEACESNLLRIAQEAVTNAVRHAHPHKILISLAYLTGSVRLEIGDTGQGMSGNEASGFGVDGMRERARQIGGEITILSDPGTGTRVIVTVPNA